MYALCFVHDDSQTENFLLYNPQSGLSERITSPHPFRVRSPLPPFTGTLAPRSLDTRPPLLPPRKLRFEISHFRALYVYVPPLSFEGGKNGNVPPPAGPSQQVVNRSTDGLTG